MTGSTFTSWIDLRGPDSRMADLIGQFFLAKPNLRDKSRSEYERYLRDFVTWANDPKVTALTPEAVNEYVRQYRRRSLYGARYACAVLKSFGSWLAEAAILRAATGGSVLRDVKTPRVPNEGRAAVDDADLDKIWAILARQPAAKRSRDTALVWLLFASGIRRNEARTIRLEDIHLDPKGSWITVRWQTSKAFASRRVRLDRHAASKLNDYIEDHRVEFTGGGPEPLFTTTAGKGFKSGGFESWCARLSDLFEANGVRDWMAHRMRHTWATWYHRSTRDTGLTVYDLKAEGGWKDLNIPLRYTKDRPWEELMAMPTPISAVLNRADRRAG